MKGVFVEGEKESDLKFIQQLGICERPKRKAVNNENIKFFSSEMELNQWVDKHLNPSTESIKKADRGKIAFFAELKEASAIRGVLKMLKMEGVLKLIHFTK